MMTIQGVEFGIAAKEQQQAQQDDSSDDVVVVVRPPFNKELHIAPMLDVSKREFRKLFSILSTQCVLWTDMIVDETIAHSDKLEDQLECVGITNDNDSSSVTTTKMTSPPNRVICQIGGNSPQLCGEATQIVHDHGYDEVNLNIDCPSDRVCGKREFGAILMKQIDTAYAVVEAMYKNSNSVVPEKNDNNASVPTTTTNATDHQRPRRQRRCSSIPVSVKCRVGVDEFDNLEYVAEFIKKLQPVCRRYTLHARRCVLDGLMTARQNRSVPPLNYPRVYELCNMFPECDFWINGGIRTLKQARAICTGRYPDKNSNCDCDSGDDAPRPELHGENQSHINNSIEQTTKTKTTLLHHAVPCALCKASNGSCTAPPLVVPPNLRGCMMGRAAMDNPSLFWDVDRYFYGLDSNPCQTRRQVLEQYCQYLEDLYPRRCCDNDERVTYKLPVPIIDSNCKSDDEYCHVCRDMYEKGDNGAQCRHLLSSNTRINRKGDIDQIKMASRLVGRSLKPVRGMFFGQPKVKAFIRACDQLAQNLIVRNCGPGFILRVALLVVDDEVLDRQFEKSEDVE